MPWGGCQAAHDAMVDSSPNGVSWCASCVAELRHDNGHVLRDGAASVSLQQDVSKGWLVIRYAAATEKLAVRHGFIGALRLPSEKEHLHALAVREAMEGVISEMACPAGTFPGSTRKRERFGKFIPRLLPKVEAMTADGASDEQLALSMMFGGDKFTSLKLAARDLPHSMRRVASRTSFADPYLKSVLLSAIMNTCNFLKPSFPKLSPCSAIPGWSSS